MLKDMRYDLWVDEWRWGLSSLRLSDLWKLATEVIVFTNVYFGREREREKCAYVCYQSVFCCHEIFVLYQSRLGLPALAVAVCVIILKMSVDV